MPGFLFEIQVSEVSLLGDLVKKTPSLRKSQKKPLKFGNFRGFPKMAQILLKFFFAKWHNNCISEEKNPITYTIDLLTA